MDKPHLYIQGDWIVDKFKNIFRFFGRHLWPEYSTAVRNCLSSTCHCFTAAKIAIIFILSKVFAAFFSKKKICA